MQILEKILQEIDEKIEVAEKIIAKPPHDKLDEIANDTAEAFIEAYKECQDIIRSHMQGDGHAQHSKGVWFEDAAGWRYYHVDEGRNDEQK